jgi:pimeloyl-ACP methyl ester carboxylesterase
MPAMDASAEVLPSLEAAADDLARMQRDPRPLLRPVLVFSGWGDPGVVSLRTASQVRAVALDTPVEARQFLTRWTMDDCLAAASEAAAALVAAAGPDATEPLEIDIIGKSMGGLVARELARDQATAERPVVRVVRVFSIASPHRGARLATLPTVDPKVVDMRPGSAFLRRLDAEIAAGRSPEIIAYTRTGDWMVGEGNTAPVGGGVRVVPRPHLEFGHLQAGGDPRILADILRRLRGEPPLLPEPR